MFGSLGWGLAMFFVGIALDHSTAFSAHPCGGPQRYEKNYTICFATFSVLMGAALLTASQVTTTLFVLCYKTIFFLSSVFSSQLLFVSCVWITCSPGVRLYE